MKTKNNKDFRDWMKSQKEDILNLIDDEKYQVGVFDKPGHDWGVFVYVEGIKLEWLWSGRCIKIGYDSTLTDIDNIQLYLEKNNYVIERIGKGRQIILFHNKCTVAQFQEIYELMQIHDIQLEKKLRVNNKESQKGVNFSNTIFQNTKERGVTIGGMFGEMVCNASGMNAFAILPEYHTKNDGEIDGVEICLETKKPISIFECQSGIHYGNFLDENHLNKALNKYLYAKEIIPTLKKVVILAGGYTNNTKKIVKERSYELGMRVNPIEVILLKTERHENEIKIVVENYI